MKLHEKYLISEQETTESYILRDAKFGSAKRTYTLRLTKDAFDKVKKDFKSVGDRLKHNKKYSGAGAKWTLFIYKNMIGNYYDVYGVSGDYSFGRLPSYMSTKLSGNKKAAKEVYDQFISDYNL